MKMPKPTESDLERFRSLVPDGPGIEVKPMFGQLAAFVNGTMFAGLFGSAVGVKLSPDAAEKLSVTGSGPFGPEERPMGGYSTLPPDMGDDEVTAWFERAHEHVATLPPKKKR
jgi:hypothetical protein